MPIIDSRPEDWIIPLPNSRMRDAASAWRTYEEQCRRGSVELEPQAERPVEDGKGMYVDVLA